MQMAIKVKWEIFHVGKRPFYNVTFRSRSGTVKKINIKGD